MLSSSATSSSSYSYSCLKKTKLLQEPELTWTDVETFAAENGYKKVGRIDRTKTSNLDHWHRDILLENGERSNSWKIASTDVVVKSATGRDMVIIL